MIVGISGCYTKFEAPAPSYGERIENDRDDYVYDDHDIYLGYGPYSGYYGYGWNGPFAYAYPYYSYNYFYSPWWYDPWYYYYGESYSSRRYNKSVRNRRGNSPDYSPPSYTPAPPPPSHPANPVRVKSTTNQSGIKKGQSTKTRSKSNNNDSGKGTRKRR